jgi:hypothetical protein
LSRTKYKNFCERRAINFPEETKIPCFTPAVERTEKNKSFFFSVNGARLMMVLVKEEEKEDEEN